MEYYKARERKRERKERENDFFIELFKRGISEKEVLFSKMLKFKIRSF